LPEIFSLVLQRVAFTELTPKDSAFITDVAIGLGFVFSQRLAAEVGHVTIAKINESA
jgi:hypothetical protein